MSKGKVGRSRWWGERELSKGYDDRCALSQDFAIKISRVYPVAVAAYVMAFAREARSNRERNKRVTRLFIFPSGKVGKVGNVMNKISMNISLGAGNAPRHRNDNNNNNNYNVDRCSL